MMTTDILKSEGVIQLGSFSSPEEIHNDTAAKS